MSARNKSEYSSIRKNEIQQYDLSGLAEKILANAGVGIYVIQDRSFVYVSELYQRMTGFDKMEIIGKRSMDFIFPADREKVRANAVRCLKMDVHEPYTYRFIRKDKEIMWVMETITSIEYHGKRAALGSFMDITEHRLAEDKLRREEQIFRIITDQSSDMIILMDLEGRILYINPVVEKLLGFKPGEAIGIKGFENIHPEDMPFFKEQFYLLTKNRDAHVLQGEIRLRHRNGSYRTFELLGSNIGDNDFIEAVIVSCRDITERKKSEEALRQSEERYRTILEGIQEGYFEVDLAGNFTFFNDPLCEIIGYPREELVGLNYKVYTKKEMAKKVFQAFNKVYITETPTKEIDWQIIRKDGTERYIETSVTLRKDIAGKIIGFRGIIHDITEREQMHQQLNYMATHDALTGLPNRTLFLDRLQVALAQSRRNHSKVAVMMLDLDHFKDINDTFGHLVGDMLLQEVGRRLTGILRHNDTVARLGGDEFIILLSDLEKKEYAAGVAKVILKALQKPFHLGNRQIASHSSIGIALFPDDGSDTESLLKKSDIAMYSVKAHGRNNYRFFAEEM